MFVYIIFKVQKGFTPSSEVVTWAEELISEFQKHEKMGKGAFEMNGKMIDMPTIKQAQKILNKVHN